MTEERSYSDFDLVIERAGDEGYSARVVDSPVGTADGSFTLPFSDLELENFMLKVGRPRTGTRRLESPEMGAAREFGTRLFGAVFHDDLRLSLRRSLDAAERRGRGLRIRLRLGGTPELAVLPWEFLFSEGNDQFLVLSAWTPIVRYLDLAQPIEPLTITPPLRILVMISSPDDYPTLEVEQEWSRIETALTPLIDRGAVTLDRTDDATLLELVRILRKDKSEYHIFHFVGHGGFDKQADDGVLVLEDGQNRSRLVSGRDLGTILHDHRSLRLVVLNACEGARPSESDPFSGAAQSLVRQGIPAVVAMQFEITDEAAIAFAQEFYAATADGLPVDASVAEARRAIFALGNDIEWGTPVLYLRTDGRLFEVDTDIHPWAVPAAAPAARAPETRIGEAEATEPAEDAETPARPPVAEAAVVAATGDAPSVADPEEFEADAYATTATADPARQDETETTPTAPFLALVLRRLGPLPVWGWAAVVLAVLVVVVAIAWLSGDQVSGTTVVSTSEGTSPTTEGTSPTTTEAALTPPVVEATRVPLAGHKDTVYGVAFGDVEGETILASGAGDGDVRLWDPVSGEPRFDPLKGHENNVDAVAFGEVAGTPLLASGDIDGVVRLWNPTTGNPTGVTLLAPGGPSWVAALAFGEVDDGSVVLASGSDDMTVRLWNPVSGELLETLTGHTARVGGVAFGEIDRGKVLASAGGDGDETVRLWDLASYQEIKLLAHPGWVVAVDFGEVNGDTVLATGGQDGKVRLWDPELGELIWESTVAHSGCAKEVCWIESVAFGEVDGGPVLFSGGEDGLIRVWDPATGDQIAALAGHEDEVFFVAFSEVDGRGTLASGGSDAKVWLWDFGG